MKVIVLVGRNPPHCISNASASAEEQPEQRVVKLKY